VVVEPQTAVRTFVSDAQVTVTDAARPGTPLSLVRHGGTWVADLPRTTARYLIRVAGAPGTAFEQTAELALTPAGVALRNPTPEVGPLVPAGGAGTPTFRLPVTLPRVRDVTAQASTALGRPWQPPPRTVEMLTDPLPAGRPHFTTSVIAPARTEVFEIAHLAVPKLVSVTWPSGVPAGSPFRFLLFLHHRIGQNIEVYGNDPYPWGRSFLEFGFQRYLDFAGPPLSGLAAGKGLAFQLSAAGRNVAIVLPMPHHHPDTPIGALANGGHLEVVLTELAAHAARRTAGAPLPPVIDRLAVASFSSGALDSGDLLTNAGSYAFLRRTLREAYRFEGKHDRSWRNSVARWLRGVPAGERARVRIYRQLGASNLAAYRSLGFALWPAAGDRTYAALDSHAMWRSAGATANLAQWYEIESLILNTMLVDALRRSGF
jgi:hypothetical protein